MAPDPEGSAHGCALFFDQGMDALSRNPRNNETFGLLCRERPFSLVRFFLARKRSELAR
jgi:hypothetical protein